MLWWIQGISKRLTQEIARVDSNMVALLTQKQQRAKKKQSVLKKVNHGK
jgi:ABC-type transporter Mla MlaB component